MKTLFSAMVVVLAMVGCTAPVGHTLDSAISACVTVCEQTAQCLGSGYPHNMTCEQACTRYTVQSPVNPAYFCEETIELDHYVACQECLLGNTPAQNHCDFSTQFEPTAPCYNVCQPTQADMQYCGCHTNPC